MRKYVTALRGFVNCGWVQNKRSGIWHLVIQDDKATYYTVRSKCRLSINHCYVHIDTRPVRKTVPRNGRTCKLCLKNEEDK